MLFLASLLIAASTLRPYDTLALNTRFRDVGSFARRQASSASSAAPTSTVSPHVPSGGVDVNASAPAPVYTYLSDFDFQSLNLALNQEWIELDLFHYGLAKFSDDDFQAAGLDAEDRFLIEWMADQEVGHATMLSNILGANAAKQCNYTYPFETVKEFVDFCQKLTRWGEAGVYGFLPHLDSRPAAQLLLQSITTEARQQMIFRQFEGLFPMPTWFETGITQSMAWTLLAPYIQSCPAENPQIVWQNFPGLNIANNPNATSGNTSPAITNNQTTPLSEPGSVLNLTWESPGRQVGYNSSFTTNTTAGTPQYAAWIAQLNVTYTPLSNIQTGLPGNLSTANAAQPGDLVFPSNQGSVRIVNDTIFVAITDTNLFVTPYNLSLLNDHIVAGPAMYQSG